jgi:hypothetical protein
MILTTISNHPHFSNITRKADVIGIHYTPKAIKLELLILHFMSNNEIGDMTKSIDLTLNNEKQYPFGETMIGDLEAFTMQSEMGAPLKDMVQQGIAAVDLDGTINGKCNYKSQPGIVIEEEEETPVDPE